MAWELIPTNPCFNASLLIKADIFNSSRLFATEASGVQARGYLSKSFFLFPVRAFRLSSIITFANILISRFERKCTDRHRTNRYEASEAWGDVELTRRRG